MYLRKQSLSTLMRLCLLQNIDLKSHLETRFLNLLDNSENLTFLHVFPVRQADDCAYPIRNKWLIRASIAIAMAH